MKWLVIVLVTASGLAGCATHTRQAGEGSALPRGAFQDPEVERLRPVSQPHSSQAWSVRDFSTPRGLYR